MADILTRRRERHLKPFFICVLSLYGFAWYCNIAAAQGISTQSADHVADQASARAQKPSGYEWVLIGKIDHKYAVRMELNRKNDRVYGRYRYLTQSAEHYLELDGTIDETWAVTLTEYESGKKTGTFEGQFYGDNIAQYGPAKFIGYWERAIGNPIQFQVVFVLHPERADTRTTGDSSDNHVADPKKQLPKIFRPLISKIKKETKLSILLPHTLPISLDEDDIGLVESKEDPDSYSIQISYGPDFSNANFAGSFSAQRGEKPDTDVDKVVILAKGIKGYYLGRHCGASCAPNQVEWVYDGALYSIQFKLGGDARRDEIKMINMANNAITAGPR
jgi:hypothetical protein